MTAQHAHTVLAQPASWVAPRLLGCELERTVPEGTIRVRIVETEAYDQSDQASHSFRGETERTAIMFGPPGRLYVYFTYGMHYCCNIVTSPAGHGAAVLLRAVEPVDAASAALLEQRRPGKPGPAALNGPAKLCQALGIDRALNGHNLALTPLRLHLRPALAPCEIVTTTRVGLSRATGTPWRFYIRGNVYVSAPRQG